MIPFTTRGCCYSVCEIFAVCMNCQQCLFVQCCFSGTQATHAVFISILKSENTNKHNHSHMNIPCEFPHTDNIFRPCSVYCHCVDQHTFYAVIQLRSW